MIWPYLTSKRRTWDWDLVFNLLNMFKEIQIEDLRSSPTEEQAEIWAVPGLMTWDTMRQHSQKPHGTAFSHAKPTYACLLQTPAFISFICYPFEH